MARYTQTFVVAILPEKLRQALMDSLESCNLSIIYSTDDYVMARELAGQIAYAKLVTVEVLIHQSSIEGDTVKLTCVTKNEELPLQMNNHCQRMADLVAQSFTCNQTWKLLENISG